MPESEYFDNLMSQEKLQYVMDYFKRAAYTAKSLVDEKEDRCFELEDNFLKAQEINEQILKHPEQIFNRCGLSEDMQAVLMPKIQHLRLMVQAYLHNYHNKKLMPRMSNLFSKNSFFAAHMIAHLVPAIDSGVLHSGSMAASSTGYGPQDLTNFTVDTIGDTVSKQQLKTFLDELFAHYAKVCQCEGPEIAFTSTGVSIDFADGQSRVKLLKKIAQESYSPNYLEFFGTKRKGGVLREKQEKLLETVNQKSGMILRKPL